MLHRWWLLALVIIAVLIISPRAQAAAFVVTSLADAGPGTLRQAILDANANAEADTITFAIAGTITLNTPLPAVSDADGIAIDGGGTITITPAGGVTIPQGFLLTTGDHVIQGITVTGFTNGIVITDGANNTIGPGNVISGNAANGIIIEGVGATGNTIISSLIGTNAAGTAANANGASGVMIRDGASGSTIGAVGQRNTISGNNDYGVLIRDPLTTGNIVQVNFIGLNELGTAALPNTLAGVRIENGTTGNTIGGGTAEARNTISGNQRSGVEINASDGNTVQNNYIGLNDAGNAVLANTVNGINLTGGSSNNIISNNGISGNGAFGINLNGGAANAINGNCIGSVILLGACVTTPLGNGLDGIRLVSASSTTLDGNTIYDNRRHGVNIASGSSATSITNNIISLSRGRGVLVQAGSGHTIQSNSIFDNTGLGIDLLPAGVTPNDAGDGDGGVNTRQNFPVLTAAANNGILRVSFNSTPNSTFTLQFFSNTACHSSGYGQGETVLLTDTVITDASGSYTFEYTGLPLVDGTFITATATNSGGSTSEFSRCRQVVAPAPVANFTAVPGSGVAPLNVSFTDQSTGIIDTWLWDFGDGSTSSQQNPAHQYTTPGTYTVSLTVSSPFGSDTITRTITVLAPSPTPPPPPPPATATPTLTPTPSVSFTPSTTPTSTASSTATITPSSTPTATRTATATATSTVTSSPTATTTPSRTPTMTATASPTATPSSTPTMTTTATPTSTPTTTPSQTPTALPTLAVDKLDQPDGLGIVVSNTGEGDAMDVQVSEALRPEVVFVSVRPGAPVCVEEAGVVTCVLGTIPGGDAASVEINVNSGGPANTSGQTTVSAAGLQPVIIDAPYISKIAEPPVAAPGSLVTYTIRVINPTDETANRVVVQDTMPAAIEILSAEASSGTVAFSGQVIGFRLDRLTPGGRATITLVTRIREDESFNEIINEACLTSSANPDPSCARMTFLRASQIPATGETPQIRRYLVAFIIGVLGAGFMLLLSHLRAGKL